MNDTILKPTLRLLVTIIDRDRVKKVIDIYREERVHLHYMCLANGTASSEILDIWGLGATDKALVLCVEPGFRVSSLLSVISKKLELKKPGNGIAFTIPISGVNTPVSQILDHELKTQIQKEVEKEVEKDVEKIKSDSKHTLVIAVVNQGFTDGVVASAKTAGATGGTIIHARKGSSEEVEKFFGISIHAEKEIVAILVSKEIKHDIMKAISHSSGMMTEARGIIFSLPVEDVEGIAFNN